MSRLSAKIELNNKLSIFLKKDYEINKKDDIIFFVKNTNLLSQYKKISSLLALNKNNCTFCLTYLQINKKTSFMLKTKKYAPMVKWISQSTSDRISRGSIIPIKKLSFCSTSSTV